MDQDKSPELREALVEIARCGRAFRWFLLLAAVGIVIWAAATVWCVGIALWTNEGVKSTLEDARKALDSVADPGPGNGSYDAVKAGSESGPAAEAYLRVYFLIQKADAARSAGEIAVAREDYEAGLKQLKEIEAEYPNWRADLVGYRKRYITDQIASIGTAEDGPPKRDKDPLPKE